MKIALLGYGKMGKVIEKIATARGHDIVLRIDIDSKDYNIQMADLAIDFSAPDCAVHNISNCLNNGVPVVSGTTGWLDEYDNIVSLCHERDGAFIYASNFSLGMNIFFEVNSKLATMMAAQSQYIPSITEIHHVHKIDAPSGTAITLAEDIISNSDYSDWALKSESKGDVLGIRSERIDETPGTHEVYYSSEADELKISHKAFNREGFGLGAVIAAEWLKGKTGIFTMKDVLNIG